MNNKKAYFDYFIEDELEVGICLKGTEVKSARKKSVSLIDSYVQIKNNELFVNNMHIATYSEGNKFNHDEKQPRKLLAHKKEILRLQRETKEKGYSIIPLKMYLKNGRFKLLIGIAKGKKKYDKRAVLKEKAIKRSQERY